MSYEYDIYGCRKFSLDIPPQFKPVPPLTTPLRDPLIDLSWQKSKPLDTLPSLPSFDPLGRRSKSSFDLTFEAINHRREYGSVGNNIFTDHSDPFQRRRDTLPDMLHAAEFEKPKWGSVGNNTLNPFKPVEYKLPPIPPVVTHYPGESSGPPIYGSPLESLSTNQFPGMFGAAQALIGNPFR